MALLVLVAQSPPAVAVSKNVVPVRLESKQREAVMQSERERERLVLTPSACSFIIEADAWRKVSIGPSTLLG